MMRIQTKKCIICVFIVFVLAGISTAVEVKPGDVITSENVDQYKDYFTSFMARFIRDGHGIVPPASPIHIEECAIPLAPDSFRNASKENIGKVTINPEDLSLTGFDYCGIPFPELKEPNLPEKIIANFYYRWRTDDYYYEPEYLCANSQQRKGGRVTCSNSGSAFIRFVGRTAPGFEKNPPNPHGLFWAQTLHFHQPAFKDLMTLTWRYLDLEKDDDMWSFIPTLRRTLRMVSSERANPMNGTPLTYDDFNGFDGRLSQFSYNLISEKKMIGMIDLDIDSHYERNSKGYYHHPIYHGPNYPYGESEAYVIEIHPKDPSYPESKKVLYMNKTNYMAMYSEVYDRKGGLWKGYIFNVSKNKTSKGEDALWFAQSVTDFKTGHWLNVVTNKNIQDSGVPHDIFDPGNFFLHF
ncbi:MAG: DUF1329 domain-containing protein [Desulfobacterales bacterium]